MELRQLVYCTTIAHMGGFRRAADALSVSQTTFSVQIKLLEGELRTSLCVRGGRGTGLTEARQLFLARTDHIMSEVGSAAKRC